MTDIVQRLRATEPNARDMQEAAAEIERLREVLHRALAAWDAIPEDEQVPDSINDNKLWDTIRLLDKT